MSNRNLYQKVALDEEREMAIYKRDDMIQKARFKLSAQEQRAVLYVISKIKPDDEVFTEYEFDIKDFYQLCGIEDSSYTRLKEMLSKLSDNGWWLTMPDGMEHRVRWFAKVKLSKKSGKVFVRFDEDMMPFLLQLTEQDEFFTYFNLKYVLPMNCKHSPRLYEILKSYHKNNRDWWFDIDRLKKLLNCENYKNFNDFEKRVLKPSVEEINKYSDIRIKYLLQREGRKVARVFFMMDKKTSSELFQTEGEIRYALEGETIPTAEPDESRVKAEWLLERRAAKRND